jgi:hypothetical protein
VSAVELVNILADETMMNSSHQPIDELIFQVRLAPLEDVWVAGIEDLTQ